MCRIMLQVPRNLADIDMPPDSEGAGTLLEGLRQWARTLLLKLRPRLRQTENNSDAESGRNKTSGLCCACSHYNAVIVATRSALVSTVLASLPATGSQSKAADALTRQQKWDWRNRRTLWAKLESVQLCRDAVYLGLSSGNKSSLQ